MRYFLLLLLLTSSIFAAKVNEKLYADVNASAEIYKIRKIVSDNVSTDPEEQNKISIQKLFLTKLVKLSTITPIDPIKPYKLKSKTKLTQKQFFGYFHYVSENLKKMKKRTKNRPILKERMQGLKEQLKDMSPDKKDDILLTQLEYAYFKWKEIFNETKIKIYEKYLEEEKKRFLLAFRITDIKMSIVNANLLKLNTKTQSMYQKKIYLELSLEKETIIAASKKKDDVNVDVNVDINHTKLLSDLKDKEGNWKYNFLVKELAGLNAEISLSTNKKIKQLILKQVDNLKQEDLNSYITVRQEMIDSSENLSAVDLKAFNLELEMLEWLKYQHIGDFTAILYDFKAWSSRTYDTFASYASTPLFYLGDKPVILADIFKMFLTIIIGFMLAKFYKNRVKALQKRVNFVNVQSFKIIGNLGYYTIIIVTLSVSLHNLGLDLSSLSLVAGALSVGIGFGLKEVVGNFVSGIILMTERSARIGDFVEIDNVLVGNITDIRMRSVTIRTSANIDVVVPNSDLVQKTFINYTLDEPIRRLSMPFTVAYGVTYEKVSEVILDALAQSELKYIRDTKEYETEVIMTGMDERGVNYILFVFVRTYATSARSSYFRLIYKSLTDNNLPIPAPRLDVKMNEVN